MPTLAIRFIGGRYHGTPWGSHVNEGLAEWPPSPWRVLRSLIATGFAKLGWRDIPDVSRSLIDRLARVLPDYRLPVGQLAHTRHYMPIHAGRAQTTTKVFDTLVRVRANDSLLIRYAVELPPAETALLERIAENLGYFGRAESWAEAALTDDIQPDDSWCRPAQNGASPLPGGDQVVLLAPLPSPEYASWLAQSIQEATARESAARGGPPTKAQLAKLSFPYPPDLLACLTSDTAFFQRHGWNQPPGSRRVLYNRPPHTLQPQLARVRKPPRAKPVEATLLALSSDTVRGDLLPLMTRCVPQAEMLHEALVRLLNDMGHRDCPVLVGKDAQGGKLENGHQHAHYLPLDLDLDGRIDHYLVYAPMRLDGVAQRAIARLRRTWTKGSDKDILVTCVGFGDLDLFRRQLRTSDQRPAPILPVRPATVWSSVTPYVPARHLKPKKKQNGGYTVEDDVRREIAVRAWLPEVKRIEVFQQQGSAGRRELVERNLLRFVKTRRRARRGEPPDAVKPQPPQPVGFGLRLSFAAPVLGPIALGYGCHFGLGLFAAEPQ